MSPPLPDSWKNCLLAFRMKIDVTFSAATGTALWPDQGIPLMVRFGRDRFNSRVPSPLTPLKAALHRTLVLLRMGLLEPPAQGDRHSPSGPCSFATRQIEDPFPAISFHDTGRNASGTRSEDTNTRTHENSENRPRAQSEGDLIVHLIESSSRFRARTNEVRELASRSNQRPDQVG